VEFVEFVEEQVMGMITAGLSADVLNQPAGGAQGRAQPAAVSAWFPETGDGGAQPGSMP
jgi:hypothetical protein